jgi:hypothetical protein
VSRVLNRFLLRKIALGLLNPNPACLFLRQVTQAKIEKYRYEYKYNEYNTGELPFSKIIPKHNMNMWVY